MRFYVYRYMCVRWFVCADEAIAQAKKVEDMVRHVLTVRSRF